jgi:hypothetical protein
VLSGSASLPSLWDEATLPLPPAGARIGNGRLSRPASLPVMPIAVRCLIVGRFAADNEGFCSHPPPKLELWGGGMRQKLIDRCRLRRDRFVFSLSPSVPSPLRGRGNGGWPRGGEKTAPAGRLPPATLPERAARHRLQKTLSSPPRLHYHRTKPRQVIASWYGTCTTIVAASPAGVPAGPGRCGRAASSRFHRPEGNPACSTRRSASN